jgi:hypothetical protein
LIGPEGEASAASQGEGDRIETSHVVESPEAGSMDSPTILPGGGDCPCLDDLGEGQPKEGD